MYPYNYNMYQMSKNIPIYRNQIRNINNNRFFPGGFIVPFLLGGLAGGAIANNRPNYYYPYPNYYNNYYYYPSYGPIYY